MASLSLPAGPRGPRDNSLCSKCGIYSTQFDTIFAPSAFPLLVERRRLSELNRNGCSMCRLLARAADTKRAYSREDLPCHDLATIYAVNLLTLHELSSVAEHLERKSTRGLVLTLRHGSDQKDFMKNEYSFHRRDGMIMQAYGPPPQNCEMPFLAKVLNQRIADFEAVQRWIRDCSLNHVKCRAHGSVYLGLKGLDCSSGDLVEKPLHANYAALSYVWGQSSLHNLNNGSNTPGKRIEHAPRTVTDAIAVTKALNYQYLWVDCYAIDQGNIAEKAQIIGMMDQIYEGAAVTIVAAAGDNDEYGLPGIGTEPPLLRNPHPTASVGGTRVLVSTLPDVLYLLAKSKWATRGWTYQESLLSSRCLIFTDEQVFLLCNTTLRTETFPDMPSLRTYQDSETTLENVFDQKFFERRFYVPPKTPLGLLERHIRMYLARSLTFDIDALNAFRGILARSPFRTFWGIPFLLENELSGITGTRKSKMTAHSHSNPLITIGFLRGLSWYTKNCSLSSRRKDMPSWSWVSMANTSITFFSDLRHKDRIIESGTEYHHSLHIEVEILAPVSSDGVEISYISVEEKFQSSEDNFVSEDPKLPYLVLHAFVARIYKLSKHRNHDFSAWRPELRSIELAIHVRDGLDERILPFCLDASDSFPRAPDVGGDYDLAALDWKLVKINQWSWFWKNLFENYQQELPSQWETFYMVVEPLERKDAGWTWKRIGCAFGGSEEYLAFGGSIENVEIMQKEKIVLY